MATTPEEMALFDAQKDYMSAVFDRILVLVEGKSIQCKMGSQPDPQKVFEKLLHVVTNSTVAHLNASSPMLTFSKILYGDGSVEPGTKLLLSMFIFFSTADPAEFLSDASKKQRVCNAIQHNLNLLQAATFEDTLHHEDPTKVYN